MNKYIELNVNLLTRLSREANDPNIDAKRYKIIAKGISEILATIEKYHGMYYLYYVAHITSLRLGHSLGPLNASVMNKLVNQGCVITKIIYF